MPVPHPTTIARADALVTEPVRLKDLEPGDYVLLPVDLEDPEVPLLVAEDYELPLLVQVDGFVYNPGETVVFTTADGVYAEVGTDGGDLVRWVVPGQDHEEWPPPVA